jgi:6-phosphogluconate dehydrogenase
MAQADIGVIGLGVMGANLALNIADNGYHVAVYNQHGSRARKLLR